MLYNISLIITLFRLLIYHDSNFRSTMTTSQLIPMNDDSVQGANNNFMKRTLMRKHIYTRMHTFQNLVPPASNNHLRLSVSVTFFFF